MFIALWTRDGVSNLFRSVDICSIFIPVDDDRDGLSQHIWLIAKDESGNVSRERLFGVRYVPLTDAPTRT